MPTTPAKQPSLPVMVDLTTISTPKEAAIIATPGPIDPAVLRAADEARIRSVPVFDAAGACLGIMPFDDLKQLAASKSDLTADRVTAKCSLMPYLVPVSSLLDQLSQLGVVLHSPDPDDDLPKDWFGIVTAADLNRPIFRAHIYQMLVILETSLGQLIMDEFGDDWGAIRLLSDNTQSRIRDFYEEEKAEGIDLSPVTNATLSDLFHISAQSNNVWKLLGFDRPEQLRDVAHTINDLRNTIMHPVRPLLVNDKELQNLVVGVHEVEALSSRLAKQIGAVTG